MTPGAIVTLVTYLVLGFFASMYWSMVEDGDKTENVAVVFFWPLCLVLYVGKCLWVWLKAWWRKS